MKSKVKFRKTYIYADDDSFYAWIIENRLPYDIFMECKKANAVYYCDMSEYGRKGFWNWDVEKAIPILQKYGYEIEEDILKEIEKEKEEERKLLEMKQKAYSLNLICPKCNKKLDIGGWGLKHITLHCYNCYYTVILDDNCNIVDKGFDDEKDKEYNSYIWYKDVEYRLEHPEKYAKEQLAKKKREIKNKTYQIIFDTIKEKAEVVEKYPEGEELKDTEFPNTITYIITKDNIYISKYVYDWGTTIYKLPKDDKLELLIRFRANKDRTDEDYKKIISVV